MRDDPPPIPDKSGHDAKLLNGLAAGYISFGSLDQAAAILGLAHAIDAANLRTLELTAIVEVRRENYKGARKSVDRFGEISDRQSDVIDAVQRRLDARHVD